MRYYVYAMHCIFILNACTQAIQYTAVCIQFFYNSKKNSLKLTPSRHVRNDRAKKPQNAIFVFSFTIFVLFSVDLCVKFFFQVCFPLKHLTSLLDQKLLLVAVFAFKRSLGYWEQIFIIFHFELNEQANTVCT